MRTWRRASSVRGWNSGLSIRRVRCFEYLISMPTEHLKVFQAPPMGKRPQSRPKIHWRDYILCLESGLSTRWDSPGEGEENYLCFPPEPVVFVNWPQINERKMNELNRWLCFCFVNHSFTNMSVLALQWLIKPLLKQHETTLSFERSATFPLFCFRPTSFIICCIKQNRRHWRIWFTHRFNSPPHHRYHYPPIHQNVYLSRADHSFHTRIIYYSRLLWEKKCCTVKPWSVVFLSCPLLWFNRLLRPS